MAHGKDRIDENEACESIAEEIAKLHRPPTTDFERGVIHAAEVIAARIRARLD